jgi:hypothetical protein
VTATAMRTSSLAFSDAGGRLSLADPGVLVADVGDFHHVAVQAGPLQAYPETWLMGAGRTAADHHPVEACSFPMASSMRSMDPGCTRGLTIRQHATSGKVAA